ncbi:hypothetical protein ABMA27_003473 [Loxostege sticticalis]|uniref:DUF7869 domain-containing protein n=1 Tax=Loxostege sticticalis TaxID=481309 RepID=A0ABR3HT89_LOXSC
MKPNPRIKRKCSNECYEINEDRRQQIFKYFWTTVKKTVQRKRTSELSRRAATFNYFINEGEGRKQVCLNFLTNTFDLNQKTVYNTVNSAVYGSAKDDSRGKHVPANKTPSETLTSVRRYIQNLPALPSHYCRKSTTRTYLPTEFKNITNLYRLYKEKLEKDGIDFVGEKVFKKVFYYEFNLGFHVPRKDKCVKCLEFENKKDNESEERKKHLKDKEETYERFKSHQVIHEKDSSILCTSFDLQKVLNTPHAVYNLTFYESGTKNGYCYTWSEVDGKRGANEVSSILRKYISKVDELGSIKHLLLYCDSCPGQNKNKINLACINETLHECTNLLSIQINYLLPGHTYMPVDSMHSVIEKSINGVIIWAPSQWPTVFCLARKSPKAYEVEPLRHTDFYKWDAVADKYFKGNLTGKISKIRVVTFKKSNLDKIIVKYSMIPDVQTEEIEVLKRNITNQLTPCYKTLLPISKKKYADLVKLCRNNTIPLMFQDEYKYTFTYRKFPSC